DTTGMRVLMAGPCNGEGCDFNAMHFTRGDMAWYAATDTSDFRIVFTPKDLLRGSYRLRVDAEDVSGNPAGEVPYEIRFRVEPDRTLMVSDAHPNPFFFETRIDVVVTGQTPGTMPYRLDIFHTGGACVRQIADSLYVGLNRVTWDGLDDQGQPLLRP